jgi:hypothetical protein
VIGWFVPAFTSWVWVPVVALTPTLNIVVVLVAPDHEKGALKNYESSKAVPAAYSSPVRGEEGLATEDRD